jgi:Domain of unknown function (DUF397)
LPGVRRLPEEDVVTRKPTVEELGIDLADQAWQRSGDADGAIEIAFVPGPAVGASVGDTADSRPGSAAAPAGAVGSGGSAGGTEWVLMRVAGDPEGRVLVYNRHEWECFLDGVRNGEFDEGAR